jgi:hypothetical protein
VVFHYSSKCANTLREAQLHRIHVQTRMLLVTNVLTFLISYDTLDMAQVRNNGWDITQINICIESIWF